MKYLKTYNESKYLSEDGKTFDCSDNKLTELPPLPDTLETLNCYSNNLTELPPLPDTIKHIYCYANNLHCS